MGSIEVDVDVVCSCGAQLISRGIRGVTIEVDACDNCTEEAYREGKSEGYAEAERDLVEPT